ncbi:MAG: radical SAM protein [Candidatus Omnitrophica bacterium]|nr:radical SAM protein [Candidatus Omnitrophota bacterium]
MELLKKHTVSICPKCYEEIPASVYEDKQMVYMAKNCHKHGEFTFLIEKDARLYRRLMNGVESQDRKPFENIMIAVTHSCNLDCPVCYLPSRAESELSLQVLKKTIVGFEGDNVRLSGGEPTLREDLPEIISFILEQGKIPSLTTNGLRFCNRQYLRRLKDAGLYYVHMSFNGLSDQTYQKINGCRLLNKKLKALRNLKAEKMNVRTSILLERGVNDKELTKMYRFCVRNLNFIHSLRIRTVVPSGRHNVFEQLYLSEILSIFSNAIKVSKDEIIKHSLSNFGGEHLPCSLTIDLGRLLYDKAEVKGTRNPVVRLVKIALVFLPRVGILITIGALIRYVLRKKRLIDFIVFIRVWPHIYSIDLNEIKRCPSAHFVGSTGEVLPFCYAIALNDRKYKL